MSEKATSRLSWRKRLLFKSAIIFGMLILFVATAEIVLRLTTEFPPASGIYVSDFEIGKTLKPGFQGVHYGVTVTISSQGLRDREYSMQPALGTLRILALGDSWTFGVGVEREETWPKRLEALLSRERRVEVMNAGVSGYETYNESIHYARNLSRFRHDVVVVGVYPVNDIHDKRVKYARAKWIYDIHPCLYDLYTAPKRSYVNLYYESWRKGRKRARRLAEHERALAGAGEGEWFPDGDDWTVEYDSGNSDWQAMVASFVSIGERARANGARAVAVLFPDIENLARYEDYCHPRIASMIEGAVRKAGFEWIDLSDAFREFTSEAANAPLRLSQGAGRTHPGPAGYDIIARAIAEEFIVRGWLD